MKCGVVRALIPLVLWCATPAVAQVVRGTITDRATHEPISGGDVVLLLQRRGLAQGKTDAEGKFELIAPGPGQYRVQFQAPGYRLVITPQFTLYAGESIDFPFQASPLSPVALDTTTVEGEQVPRYLTDFYERKAKGFGEFVVRDDFERYNPSEVSDVLRHTRSFDITYNANAAADAAGGVGPGRGPLPVDTRTVVINGRRGVGFGSQGRCPPLMYVDGTFVGNAADADIDAIVAIGSIEAMELYEGGVQVPAEFSRNGSNCGVIAIWSRATGGELGPVAHRIDVGSQFGGRVASDGFESGRAGVRATMGLIPGIEGHVAFNVYLPGLHGPASPQTGWQVTLALRVHPLGASTPWYVGAGGTSLTLHNQGAGQYASVQSEEHELLLTGISLPAVFRLRPLVEMQVLEPLSSGQRQVHLYTGLTIRLQ